MKTFTAATVISLGLSALAPARAVAGDIAAPIDKAPPAAAVYNWSGWYGGLNAGYGWGNSHATFVGDEPTGAGTAAIQAAAGTHPYAQPLDSSGAIGGGQIGYNWYIGPRWIAGMEADIQLSGVEGDSHLTTVVSNQYDLTLASSQRIDWFGTLRGRVGVLFNDRLLGYVTGGLAYGEARNSASLSANAYFTDGVGYLNSTVLSCPNGFVCLADSKSKTTAGWTAGGGLEFAAWNNVTLKVEYLHVDLGDQMLRLGVQSPSTGDGYMTAKFDNSFDIGRVGFNVKY